MSDEREGLNRKAAINRLNLHARFVEYPGGEIGFVRDARLAALRKPASDGVRDAIELMLMSLDSVPDDQPMHIHMTEHPVTASYKEVTMGQLRAALAALPADQVKAECPSCHGLNISCPDGCGRDPLTGELNGTRFDQVKAERERTIEKCAKVARDYASKARNRGWPTATDSAAKAADHIATTIRSLRATPTPEQSERPCAYPGGPSLADMEAEMRAGGAND